MDNRKELMQKIRESINCKDYLTKAPKGGYCCPFCGSGTRQGTGALKVYDTNTFTCFSCGKSGDVIDIYMELNDKTFSEAITDLATLTGSNAAQYSHERHASAAYKPHRIISQSAPERPQSAPERPQSSASKEPLPDNTEYYARCAAMLQNDTRAQGYLQSRGIGMNTASKCNLGYDSAKDRLIIPVNASYYVARAISPDAAKRYDNPQGVPVELFNLDAFNTGRPVFVVEGAMDALSIIEAGCEAIALNGTSNWKKLVEYITTKSIKGDIIISVDNDEAGEKMGKALMRALQEKEISFTSANIAPQHKDANEALMAEREQFIEIVREKERSVYKPDNVADYIAKRMAPDIQKFRADAERKTGFATLDKVAGGIYTGLYTIGGISSVGKTTFVAQIADQLAEQGQHVLYFSLEQSKLELISKSIARKVAKKDNASTVTSLSIRKGILTEEVLKAADEYRSDVAERLSVIEGNFDCTVGYIRTYTETYMRRNNVRPIVIVDYLQVLRADIDPQTGRRPTDTRQIVEGNVTELKRISRSLDIPVLVISSLNRGNYLAPIDFESFKESGGIEYTSDVVWGLQLCAINDDLFNREGKMKEKREKIRTAKAALPRNIELVCLKNRYGISSYNVQFTYYPQCDLFTEMCKF